MATWLMTGASGGLGRGIAKAALEARRAELSEWAGVSARADFANE